MKTDDIDKQKHYNDRIKSYEATIQQLLQKESAVLNECRKEPEKAAVKLFSLSNDMLDLASNYIVLSGISRSIFNNRDEVALNEARKTIFKALIYLENIVTGKVDAPFSDYEKNLAELDAVPLKEKYQQVLKIGLAVELLKNAFGDNSKWRWTFVDIEGRYAAVAKNLFDFKAAFINLDPANKNYEVTMLHLRRLKELLYNAADRYHERFEISSKQAYDLLTAINFLGALQKICIITSEKDEAEEVKRKYKNWEAGYEIELKKARTNASQKDGY
jgi:hypothetical protein